MSRYPSGDPVEEARLLLPWYITGKLSDPERKLVERMLEQHAELKQEYHRELRMVDMIRANSGLLQLTAVDTTQQRLEKLMKRIGREEQAKGNVPSTAARSPAGKKPAFEWQEFFRSLFPQVGWLTPANAVFAVLLLVQAGFLGWFAHSLTAPNDGIYITADVADNKSEMSVVSGMVLLVGFNENAQMRQVQAFLTQWNARILDGPDANNLFRIEIRSVAPAGQRSDLILQEIQQDQAVIAFVGREF